MSFKRENEFDMDKVSLFLKDATARVKNEENPEILNEFKKVYKQNVPLSLRMYVAAYLVKEAQRPNGRFAAKNRRGDDYNFKNTRRAPRETAVIHDKPAKACHASTSDVGNDVSHMEQPQESHGEHVTRVPRVRIDESLATTIFIGIGRNRRVYPRDLVGLLVAVAGIDRDRIGDIRVLANYSFIQLFSEDADKAISTLNGYDYRGRKLSVSYSRQKGEDSVSSDDENTSVASSETEKRNNNFVPNKKSNLGIASEDAAAYAAAEKAAINREPFVDPVNKSELKDEATESNELYI